MQLSDETPTWRSVEVEDGATTVVARGLDGDGLADTEAGPFKKSVRALLAENARLRSVLGHCPKGIAVLDEAGNLAGFNREFVGLVGREPKLGEPIAGYFAPTDRELLRTVVERAGTTKRAAAVVRIETDGSSPREIEFLAATLPSSGERSIGVVLAGDDRTGVIDDETARATLDDANRRDTFALALSSLRRDVEAVRSTALEALHSLTPASDGDRARIEEATRALETQGTLLGAADRLSARPDGTCDVGEAAEAAARLAWVGRARRRVTIDAQIADSIRVAIARGDLVQVLANVLRHAVDAVEQNDNFGWVTIGAEAIPSRGVVEIAVRDNGTGIPPHILKRCFEPGEIGRVCDDGQALGLAIVRSIVEARGGSVRALSEPDRGTTIVLTLPAA